MKPSEQIKEWLKDHAYSLVISSTMTYKTGEMSVHAMSTFSKPQGSGHRGTNKIAREWRDRLQYTHKCHQNYDPKKTADTSKDKLLLGGGIRHLTAMSQYHAHSKQVLACVSSIV